MNRSVATLIFLIGTVFGLAACNGITSTDKVAQGIVAGPSNKIEYSLIERSSDGVSSAPRLSTGPLLVAKNMTEAELLWKDYQDHKAGVPTVMPSIDFNLNMLVSVRLMTPTPCYESEVEITKETDVIVVTHKKRDLSAPGLSCMQVLAYSTMVLTMPKSNLALQFRDE